MELELHVSTANETQTDLSCSVEAEHSIGDLLGAMANHLAVPTPAVLSVRRGSGWSEFGGAATIVDAGLVSGDEVHLGPAPQGVPFRVGLARLAIAAGPGAGRFFSLNEGAFSVGRSSDCDITLNDPSISRRQLVLEVTGGDITLHPDPDASNPVRLDGHAVKQPTVLEPGAVLQLGSTSLRLREPSVPQARTSDHFGRVPFHRTPYFRAPIPEVVIEPMGNLPVKPKPRRFQVLAVIAPVVMGVAMVLLIGNMRYLLMAGFSPILAIGNWFDQRRQGGKEYDEKVAAFEGAFRTRADEITNALREERKSRLDQAPDIELLARRADSRHNELWQRDRGASDFLSLRVGIGERNTRLTIKPERSGDPEYLARVEQLNASAAALPDVPVSVNLAALGTLAAVGGPGDTQALVSALLIQAVCLHSPEDMVVLAALPNHSDHHEWLKWVPHTRAPTSPISGPQVASDPEAANDLIRSIAKVAEERAGERDRNVDRRWPWLLVVVDQSLEPDPSAMSRVLDLGPSVGVSVIWTTSSHDRVPRQAQAVVHLQSVRSETRSEVHFVDPDVENKQIDPEQVDSDIAGTIARSLAAMRDATATNAVTAIPRTVPLFASLGVNSIDPSFVMDQWNADKGYVLNAPIGMTDSGVIELDLVQHGPHGLIGGTSGAGKSELVQSLVVNLAVCNSPDRINFLFVDYKGGALSEMFKDIPHTVGAVTNLDALLALRALTSLTAELDRRMELFKGRAQDIKDMLAKYPDEAPPSLVIVVDEFAALVRELPEFVDGIVSIAERGRSLGIHLLMSTQRPSGAINDNIQQNTNLRIALRMLDSGESNNVIGTGDAALIPGPLKGRGLARLGPGELIPFQSAWSGAPLMADAGTPSVVIHDFAPAGMPVRSTGGTVASADSTRTQLDATLDAIVSAAQQMNVAPGRAPWKEVLPDLVPLAQVLDNPRSAPADVVGQKITIGMIDDPKAQDQYPGQCDFADGAVAIFGNGGSGKTTLLMTLAMSAAIRDSERGGDGLTFFALDFASRDLGLLARLPQTSAVATGDDLESVTRILSLLSQRMEAQRAAMAAATSRGEQAPVPTPVVLLIDGYENMVQTFDSGGAGQSMLAWLDLANKLIVEGRQYGINVAFTAARRSAVRSSVMSAITNRYVLRQSETTSYSELGVPSKLAKDLELRPGQGFDRHNDSIQFAVAADLKSPEARAELIAAAESLVGTVPADLRTNSLPSELAMLTGAPEHHARLGVADETLHPVDLDLTYNNVVVVGPPRSGKSNVLVVIAKQLVQAGVQVWAVGPAGSPLDGLAGIERSAFGRAKDLVPVIEELAVAVESFPDISRALLFDDVDTVDERSMYDHAQLIIDEGVRVVGSMSSMRGFGSNPLLSEMKNARTQIVLQPVNDRDVQEIASVNPGLRPGLVMPEGRGVLVADRIPTVLQISDAQHSGTDAVDEEPAPTAQTDPDSDSALIVLPSKITLRLGSGEAVAVSDSVMIGRRPAGVATGDSLTLDDGSVSRAHVRIERTADGFVAIDQNSRNGTQVRRLDGAVERLGPDMPVQIGPGDLLRAGKTTIAIED